MFDLRITPTIKQVAEARTVIEHYQADLDRLDAQVRHAEAILQKAVEERDKVADRLANAKSYVSPGRRLPREILEHIFQYNFIPDGPTSGSSFGGSSKAMIRRTTMVGSFDDQIQEGTSMPASQQQQCDPLAPFTYANVCVFWRQVCLSKPAFFSKIRIGPRMKSPCALLRLWMERSGLKAPLDVEIEISMAFQPPRTTEEALRMSLHADQIEVELASAMYLLVAHMERWSRFVLLGDVSDRALVPLTYARGRAPLLRCLEVSTRVQRLAQTLPPPPEDGSQWGWLERLRREGDGGALEALRMENVHFAWTTAKFAGLRHLILRCSQSGLPTGVPWTPSSLSAGVTACVKKYTVDEVLSLLSANPNLVTLCLQMPVHHSRFNLPLPFVRLERLKHLELYDEPCVEGMSSVIGRISAPLLETISLATSGHFGPGDVITPFLNRSNFPPLRSFTYHNAHQNQCSYQGLPSGSLQHMGGAVTMTFTRVYMESILAQIGVSCKRLRRLTLASLEGHALTSAIAKLIELVNDRNPDGGRDEDEEEDGPKVNVNAVSPTSLFGGVHVFGTALGQNSNHATKRIRFLEFLDCGEIEDGIMQWFKGRVSHVRKFNREPIVVVPMQRAQSGSEHSTSP